MVFEGEEPETLASALGSGSGTHLLQAYVHARPAALKFLGNILQKRVKESHVATPETAPSGKGKGGEANEC